MLPTRKEANKLLKDRKETEFEENKQVYINQLTEALLNTDKRSFRFSGGPRMRKELTKELEDAGWTVEQVPVRQVYKSKITNKVRNYKTMFRIRVK